MPNYQLINVCLVPDEDTEEGIEFVQEAIHFSDKLNQLSLSYYQLSQDRNDSIYSRPHCTLSHVKIPYYYGNDYETWAEIQETLEPIIGRSIVVEIPGLAASVASIFNKDDIINGITNNTKALAYWFKVANSLELAALQAEVIQAIDLKGECITSKDDNYAPHFTLWANTENSPPIEPNTESIRNTLAYNRSSFFIPCKVALGNCGPHGQVCNWSIKVDEITNLPLKT